MKNTMLEVIIALLSVSGIGWRFGRRGGILWRVRNGFLPNARRPTRTSRIGAFCDLFSLSIAITKSEAGDSFEVIHKAKQLPPDVVPMDVSMPRVNGLEATRPIGRELPEVGASLVGTQNIYPGQMRSLDWVNRKLRTANVRVSVGGRQLIISTGTGTD